MLLVSSSLATPRASVVVPEPRGPVSERLLDSLRRDPHDVAVGRLDTCDEEDLQLALYCCYELSYRGLPGVHPEWEWEPSLLAVRRRLEAFFLDELRELVGPLEMGDESVPDRLWAMASSGDGPSLSGWVAEKASLDHLREFAVHRSAYQLKEADPHTWGIPRLAGEAKAVMVAIQADEYGNGSVEEMHSSLFADTMVALGLDPTPNRYLDYIPGTTLATTNLISFFGLHRRWRGALVGHLALFEMTSTGPMARYSQALSRLGLADGAARFYDVHVEVDSTHEKLAAETMVGGLLRQEPELSHDVLFGAAALSALETRFARSLLERWERGATSLREPSRA